MMKNFTDMMKQAQGLQQKMQEMQETMAGLEAEGQAGGGLVKVMLNGKGYASKVTIDPGMFVEDEKEVLEDLITAAINDAKAKLEEQSQQHLSKMTEGMPLPPGMKLPF